MKRIVFLFLFLLLGLLLTSNAFAQDSNPPGPSDDQINAIAKQLYCPVCENIPLDVCGTQACAQWRDLIRQKLVAGWTETQIKQYFVDQYGDRVLATPPPRGFNWLVYIIPPLVILAGLFILYSALRSWRRPVSQVNETGKSASLPDEYLARLEAELKKR
jgi:cytochrome c-type biogenesis protein CcmH